MKIYGNVPMKDIKWFIWLLLIVPLFPVIFSAGLMPIIPIIFIVVFVAIFAHKYGYSIKELFSWNYKEVLKNIETKVLEESQKINLEETLDTNYESLKDKTQLNQEKHPDNTPPEEASLVAIDHLKWKKIIISWTMNIIILVVLVVMSSKDSPLWETLQRYIQNIWTTIDKITIAPFIGTINNSSAITIILAILVWFIIFMVIKAIRDSKKFEKHPSI